MSELTPEEERFTQELTEKATERTYRLDSDKRAHLYQTFEQKYGHTRLIQYWVWGAIGISCLALAIVFFTNNKPQATAPALVEDTITIAPSPIELAWAATDSVELRIKETRFRLSQIEASGTINLSSSIYKNKRNLQSRISTLREDLS